MPTPVADDFEFIRKRRDEIRNDEPIDRPPPPEPPTPEPGAEPGNYAYCDDLYDYYDTGY